MSNLIHFSTDWYNNHSISFWMWISIIELFVIMWFVFFRKKEISKPQSVKEKFRKESKKENIDFDNIIHSSFHSKQFYENLKIKCHPDRFVDDEVKNKTANLLFQEISKNRTNYQRLMELEKEAKQKLNINL